MEVRFIIAQHQRAAKQFADRKGWRWLNGQGSRWQIPSDGAIVVYLSSYSQILGLHHVTIYAVDLWWKNPQWDDFMSRAVCHHFLVVEHDDQMA